MFRIAHLSDPHIGPLPKPRWRELIGKGPPAISTGGAAGIAPMTWTR